MIYMFSDSQEKVKTARVIHNPAKALFFGPKDRVDGLRFKDGDRIYLVGAVHPDVERTLRNSILINGADVAVVRQR